MAKKRKKPQSEIDAPTLNPVTIYHNPHPNRETRRKRKYPNFGPRNAPYINTGQENE